MVVLGSVVVGSSGWESVLCKRRRKPQARREDGAQGRRRVRLSVQGGADRRFRCGEVQSAFQIYAERVLPGVEVDHWRGVCHSIYPGIVRPVLACNVVRAGFGAAAVEAVEV